MAYCPLCGKYIGEKPFDKGGWCTKCVGTKEYMELEGRAKEWEKNQESKEMQWGQIWDLLDGLHGMKRRKENVVTKMVLN